MNEQYYRPQSLTDALAWQQQHHGCVAAGCTDLFPATNARQLPGQILDITAIDALRGVSIEAETIRIGATTSWSDVLRADLPGGFGGLKQAAIEIGSVQIQNGGTIGGNLCHASPAADSVPALLTLDAEVELCSNTGRRCVALNEFLSGPRQTILADDELMTAVLVPRRSGSGFAAFSKLGARRFMVISIAMVAVRLEVLNRTISTIALAVGACSPVAFRLSAVEALLHGQSIDQVSDILTDDDLIGDLLAPIDDIRAEASYRRHAAARLVRQTVDAAILETEATR